ERFRAAVLRNAPTSPTNTRLRKIPACRCNMGILRWLMAAVVLGALPATAQVADLRSTTQFRVCADPANAPMSMRDGSGFENKLAEAFGEWLGVPVTFTWFA